MTTASASHDPVLPSPAVTRGWRTAALAVMLGILGLVILAALLEFLAPDLSYQVRNRTAEVLSGRGQRPFRVALGATTGSAYRLGTVLNQHLARKKGYELELVANASPGNVKALLNPSERIDLATINSADDEAVKSDGIYGLAAVQTQYFFVIVPNESPVREFRDLSGPLNPGARDPGDPPTLGERVLDYYGFLSSSPRVSIVRPKQGMVADLQSGHSQALTRTQFLHAGFIDDTLRSGDFRLVPIRDHDALAKSIPGTKAEFIPSGLYGPDRRIPPEPVPTLTVTQLLVARADVPGRVVRDILEVIYDPRFARELQLDLSEETGRKVGALPLHRAAEIYYHRTDLPTSDRLGRISFVVSAIAGLVATIEFVSRHRRNERVTKRRKLLEAELAKLESIRHRIGETREAAALQTLIRDADDLLCRAEVDAAAGLLDTPGIQSLRSLHDVCLRTAAAPDNKSVPVNV
jgi:uncharacterized protein